jgi:hypothetical protein
MSPYKLALALGFQSNRKGMLAYSVNVGIHLLATIGASYMSVVNPNRRVPKAGAHGQNMLWASM